VCRERQAAGPPLGRSLPRRRLPGDSPTSLPHLHPRRRDHPSSRPSTRATPPRHWAGRRPAPSGRQRRPSLPPRLHRVRAQLGGAGDHGRRRGRARARLPGHAAHEQGPQR
jgi:hypothetical protein